MADSTQSSRRWPWWRVLCGAAIPWLVGIVVAIAGAPAWAAIGFGIVTAIVAMGFAAVGDVVRDLRDRPTLASVRFPPEEDPPGSGPFGF